MDERWIGALDGATEALKNLDEATQLDGAPFVIPELETSGVELKAAPAKAQRDSFHQQLLLREGCVAAVARLAIAGTAPTPSDAGMRKAPLLDLASDEKTERFLFHRGLMGNGERKHEPNSPGSPTFMRPRCRRAKHSTDGEAREREAAASREAPDEGGEA